MAPSTRLHFINPCRFGEGFAAWLKDEISSLAKHGFCFSEPIQEDYGWRARNGKETFWLAISYAGEGPQKEPVQWVVSIDRRRGLNPFARLFRRPNAQTFSMVRDRVWSVLRSNRQDHPRMSRQRVARIRFARALQLNMPAEVAADRGCVPIPGSRPI